jgi:peroxiredoxin
MTTSRKPQKQIWKILSPIAVILLLVIGALKLIQMQSGISRSRASHLEVIPGHTISDFALTQIDGKSVQISEISQKIILINFWATWCEACMVEMPSLVALRDSFHQKGLEILGINLDENPTSVVPKTIREYQIKFPIYLDPEGKVAELFNVHAIPLTVIMNSQRQILYVKDGEQNWNSPSVRSQIERWLTQ